MHVARRPILAFAALFVVGALGGLVELIADAYDAGSEDSGATATWVHIVLASLCLLALVVGWHRNRQRLAGVLRYPFSAAGGRRLVDAGLSLPLAVAELGCLGVGRDRSVVDIEAWRARRLADRVPSDSNDEVAGRPRPWRFVAGGFLSSAVASVLALVVWYVPLRAGEQVFAALDPDFTQGAWGGPSYLGASVTHWFDLALVLYAASGLIVLVTRRRRARRIRLLPNSLESALRSP